MISGLWIFSKKNIERFFCLKNAKFLFMDQITCKNCNKRSWMQVNKILLNRDCPEQFSSFFVRSFQWNQTTMRWGLVSTAYHFLKNLAVWIAYYFLRCLKPRFKIFWKHSYRICSNFDIIDAIIASTNSLKRFLKRTLGTEKAN